VAAYTGVKIFSRGDPAGVIFVGDPGSLTGDVWLENSEPRDLQLRRASVVSTAVQAADPTDADRIAHIAVPRSLRAHQRQLLSVSFDVDRTTPPGTYDVSIVLEGAEGTTTFPGQIIVTQEYALTIEPDQLVVSVPPSGTFEGQVVVINDGNVPIDIVALGEFPLEDPWRAPRCCCCCHDEDGKHVAHDEGEAGDDREFGTIVIDNDKATIEPGASTMVRFVARLPQGLPANTHLRARPRIGIERFNLDVITAPAGNRVEEPRSESAARRSQQQKKKRS
jgi:hypothetical protein